MGRRKRKDLEYDMLSSAICALRYKELVNYFYTIGRINFYQVKIFKDGIWDGFAKRGKDLAVKLEIERSITYKEYRDAFSNLIQECTKEEFHDKLILLVRESFGVKDEDELYEIGKKIFID